VKALNQLKRYLDVLERNYLTAREKHHNLQLQNYKDKSINVGEFDPERLEVLSSTSVYFPYAECFTTITAFIHWNFSVVKALR